jgi:hypothetical protein
MPSGDYDRMELIVDGRGGITDPSDNLDPFERVSLLEEILGYPLCALEIVETTTVVTTTTTRRVITLRRNAMT